VHYVVNSDTLGSTKFQNSELRLSTWLLLPGQLLERCVELAREHLDSHTAEAAWRSRASMSMSEAAAYALSDADEVPRGDAVLTQTDGCRRRRARFKADLRGGSTLRPGRRGATVRAASAKRSRRG
jgi:hypothetical protein